MNIAIDGPAGAGKSTIAKRLAARLGFLYLDTGAMYRAVALNMLQQNIALTDEVAVQRALHKLKIDIAYNEDMQKIYLNGEDVSQKIREHLVSKAASDVSALPCVRLKLVELQRKMAAKTDSILDGRDIGTFVLPDAQVKFFLVASIEERARRRYEELKQRGTDCCLEGVRKDIEMRDYNDMHRDFAPLKKAEDAVVVDTTYMSIEAVTEHLLSIINGKKV